jgi:hypothetical protein
MIHICVSDSQAHVFCEDRHECCIHVSDKSGPAASKQGGTKHKEADVVAILWLILAIVLAVWLVGLLTRTAGSLIHALLIVALAILIYNLVTGRRAV